MPLAATVEYKADGTETMTSSYMGQNVNVQGTYKYEDDTLSQTITGITAAGRNIPVPGAKSQDATVKLDGDTLTLTPKSGNAKSTGYTLHRQAN